MAVMPLEEPRPRIEMPLPLRVPTRAVHGRPGVRRAGRSSSWR